MWLLGYIRADWSSLPSLKPSIAQPLQLGIHWRQYLYPPDSTFFESMTNLVELELLGFVELKQLRDIVNAVRRTLRTLACYQICPNCSPAAWLAPVTATPRKLTLYMHYYGSLGDLSCLTSLRELHVVVQGTPPESYQDNCALYGLPSSVQQVNWTFFDPMAGPENANEWIRQFLSAADRGGLRSQRTRCLTCISVEIHSSLSRKRKRKRITEFPMT